jgi:epoxide hydrolase
VPVAYLKELAAYWRTGYDWREHEAKLNEFPQYTTEIDGMQIHFVHVRSNEPDALPVLITHSWPSSIVEFMGIIGPRADPGAHGGDPAQAFDVVAPSIPGFGFSQFPEPPDQRPWSIARVARAWAELMRRLGYQRYGAHGNDAGAMVSPELARVDAEHMVGVHITAGLGIPTGDPAELQELTEQERAGLERVAVQLAGGSGYAPYLANRPQTLSYGLVDSPVAQLAWLVERFTEFDGWPLAEADLPNEPIDRDQLLTNATLYWLTRTAGSSSWTYYEGAAGMPVDQTKVPTGVSHAGPGIRRLAERKNTIVHWSDNHSPSHMVAMAVPDQLVGDIPEFFRRFR